jgi:hypothetical protein
LTGVAAYDEMITLNFSDAESRNQKRETARRTGGTKYDAHHKVLSQTYGAFADLRRELSDSKKPSADARTS